MTRKLVVIPAILPHRGEIEIRYDSLKFKIVEGTYGPRQSPAYKIVRKTDPPDAVAIVPIFDSDVLFEEFETFHTKYSIDGGVLHRLSKTRWWLPSPLTIKFCSRTPLVY